MQSRNYKRRLKHIIAKAKTKDGENVPSGYDENNISAISFYYMLDKDSWQLKIWLFPTNKSKTYNLPIKEDDIPNWVAAIKSMVQIDDYFEDEKDEWSEE